MRIHWPLLLWMFRPLRLLTAIGTMTAVAYVMSSNTVLNIRTDMFVMPFVMLHSFLISRILGRVRSESFAYLYSQGFSRNTLWRHLWLATGLSVLATWCACAFVILTPVRGQLQDWMQNPWFPLMAGTEWPYLVGILVCYAAILPVFHYEWIRSAMPYRDLISGHLLALAYVVSVGLLYSRLTSISQFPWQWCFVGGLMAGSVILGFFGRTMHEKIEVRS